MCSPHSTCVPYEKTLCKAGTQEQDTMCKCSQSHTPSPKECDCFTNNDVCYCKHIGCPNGTSINEGWLIGWFRGKVPPPIGDFAL